jgi:hypothetical protein
VAKLERWVAKLGRWVDNLWRWVSSLGRWEAKLRIRVTNGEMGWLSQGDGWLS